MRLWPAQLTSIISFLHSLPEQERKENLVIDPPRTDSSSGFVRIVGNNGVVVYIGIVIL